MEKLQSKHRWLRDDFQTNVSHLGHETHCQSICFHSIQEKSVFETIFQIKSEGHKAENKPKTKSKLLDTSTRPDGIFFCPFLW